VLHKRQSKRPAKKFLTIEKLRDLVALLSQAGDTSSARVAAFVSTNVEVLADEVERWVSLFVADKLWVKQNRNRK
jgi:hypothetical protein